MSDQIEKIKTIKGFDRDWKCRGFQFEVGKEYTHAGDVLACNSGFHGIEGHPLAVLGYYPPARSRYAICEQSGDISRDMSDSKIATRHISVKAEISIADLVSLTVEWVSSRALAVKSKSAKKDNSAASATGDYGAASATGDYGAASATGFQGAASATGDYGAASATGFQGAASATGFQSAASATGVHGAASATGFQGAASATGEYSVAVASGYQSKAMGADGCALFLVFREDGTNKILHARGFIVGRDGVEPNVFYMLDSNGNLVKA